jgi:hypothetical protein
MNCKENDYETGNNHHGNISADYFYTAFAAPRFSGESYDQSFRCADVDERPGVYRYRRPGNLALERKYKVEK